MPWLSDGYDPDNYSKLKEKYASGGIPCLVILNEDGETAAHTLSGASEFREFRTGFNSKDTGPFMALANLVKRMEKTKSMINIAG